MKRLLHRGTSAFWYNHLTRNFLALENELSKYGFTLVDFDPDVIWCHSCCLTQEFLDSDIPIILEDFNAGPELTPEVQKFLGLHQIRGVLKAAIFSEKRYHESLMLGNSYHSTQLLSYPTQYNISGSLAQYNLSEECFKKIIPSYGYPQWQSIQNEKWIQGEEKRPFDFCLLTGFNYHWELIKRHRFLAWETVRDLPHKCLVRNPNQTAWPKGAYLEALRLSKICISPWGYDYWCLRDYEAILSGCILIKPNLPEIRGIPEISFTSCKPDFSDLQEVIVQSLEIWNTTKSEREKAKTDLLQSMSLENIGKQMFSHLEKL
jgi:DNA repair exonuclease SbcCD nuclease subunit